MKPRALYNEYDPYAADWIRNLIRNGLIPDGDVDDRSIIELKPSDLDGYTQVHLFAGLGGWGLALRNAGWPDSRSCWSLSCPCQPFSSAGKREGKQDERHLWPVAYELIKAKRPRVIFGEQVAISYVIGSTAKRKIVTPPPMFDQLGLF